MFEFDNGAIKIYNINDIYLRTVDAMAALLKRINFPKAALVCYAFIMAWLLFGQRIGGTVTGTYWENVSSNVMLTPFQTVDYYYRSLTLSTDSYSVMKAVVNLVGNVVMFVPLGFLLPWVFPKLRNFFIGTAFSALCIILIELIQLFTLLGCCDIDDFILNMVGALIGRLLFKLKSD